MGGSSSKKTTNQTTNISKTTTSIGDIGFTGKDAIVLNEIYASQNLQSQRIQAAALESITQTVGKSYQQLVGGASQLIQASVQQTRDTLATGSVVQGAGQVQFSDAPGSVDFPKLAIVLGAGAALIAIFAFSRK